MSSNRQADKEDVVHRTMEYYSAITKRNLAIMTTWMELEGIILSEISQTEKEKYLVLLLICKI